jgi:hypothetical protein
MFAQAATGRLSVREAVQQTHRRCVEIFRKWRQQGLVGGGRDR